MCQLAQIHTAHKAYRNMTAKGDILPEELPPTPRAAYYHSLQVHLQVVTWE